jgi:hypothetical protein
LFLFFKFFFFSFCGVAERSTGRSNGGWEQKGRDDARACERRSEKKKRRGKKLLPEERGDN